jgi:hypothetical protein
MNKSGTLRLYALALLVIGLASAFFNAETSAFGYNSKGVSGLIADGSAAVIALVLSFFAAKNLSWAHWSGAILAFMFLIMGFKNGFLISRAINAGTEPAFHWYKAALFGATAFVSLAALMPLLIYIRRDR